MATKSCVSSVAKTPQARRTKWCTLLLKSCRSRSKASPLPVNTVKTTVESSKATTAAAIAKILTSTASRRAHAAKVVNQHMKTVQRIHQGVNHTQCGDPPALAHARMKPYGNPYRERRMSSARQGKDVRKPRPMKIRKAASSATHA